MKELKLKGINDTDRVFEHDGAIVKVRLVRELRETDGSFNPDFVAFKLSASLCGKDGKALKTKHGYCIAPHVMSCPIDKFKQEYLDAEVVCLVERAAAWKKKLDEVNKIETKWKQKPR